MSPEQARGKVVDKRTDIWAFGCVLYEMLTGERAFAGETTSHTIVTILEREPDWSRLPSSLAAGVVGLLHRCLEKDPKRRLRDIGDARLEFNEEGAPTIATGGYRRWALMIGVTTALASVAAAFIVRAMSPGTSPVAAAIERVTFDAARAQGPAISPDGRLLAFGSDRSGRGDLDIWIQQLAGGSPVRLTDDSSDETDPNFSPDGSQILFRSERDGGGVYVMSSLGAGQARLVVRGGRNPRFSPDGRWIAYWTGQFRGDPSGTTSSIFIIPIEGGAPIQLASNFYVARDPVWAPDSQSVLMLGRRERSVPLAAAFDWWWTPIDGRPPARTEAFDLHGWRNAAALETLSLGQWTPSGVLFAESGNLWSLPLSPAAGRITALPTQLAHGAGLYRSPSTSHDGEIVFAETTTQRIIERAPLGTVPATDPPIELYADGSGTGGRASQTRDGSTIIFERRWGQRDEIWRKALPSGQQEVVLTVESAAAVNPTVSPDGLKIGYSVQTDQRQSVTVNGRGYVVDTSGGVPRPVCDNCGIYEFLSDGRRAVVATGDTIIQLIDVVSGAPRDLVRTRGERIERPSVSPDDRVLAWRRTVGITAKILVAPMPAADGGLIDRWSEIDEPTTTGRPAGWSADSRTLYLLLDADGYRCLWGQRVDAHGHLIGKPFAARHFHDRRGANAISTSLGNAVSSRGFLYETNRVAGDLWRLRPRVSNASK